ncbi:MAG: hypothetical protein M3Q56_05070 [Bacteroidota bacterium]|nr:hypothetical protein [Bacteroidota bacterium]
MNFIQRILTACLVILCQLLSAQLGDLAVDSATIEIKDTVDKRPLVITSFYADNPIQLIPFDSTKFLLKNTSRFSYIQLNNIGAEVYWPDQFKSVPGQYNHGFYANYLYSKQAENFTLYKSNKPITELLLSQGRSFVNSESSFQDNLNIGILFSATFRNNVSWTIQYDRINQKGIYQNARNKLGSFGSAVQYLNNTQSFGINIMYVSNRFYTQHNNGITSDSFLLDSDFRVRESIPVFSTTANTNTKNDEMILQGFYQLFKNKTFWNPTLKIKSAYQEFSRTFNDDAPTGSALIYQHFFSDSNLLRQVFTNYSLKNEFGLSFQAASTFHLYGGIQYQQHRAGQDTLHRTLTFPGLQLRGETILFQKQKISAEFYVDFNTRQQRFFSVTAQNVIGKIIKLQSNYRYAHQSIPEYYNELWLNRTLIWKNSFKNSTSHLVQFDLSSNLKFTPLINLSFESLDDFVYLDSTLFPKLSNQRLLKIALMIAYPVNVGNFGLENKLYVARYDPDPAGVSQFQSWHDLHYKTKLFKKVVVSRIGVQCHLRNYDRYQKFLSVIQTFYSGPNRKNELKPAFHAYFQFTVREFSASLLLENLDSFFYKLRPAYTVGYPEYDFFGRIGIQWKLIY